MQRTLEDFLRSLRDNDVAISPTEAIDAHRALVDIGYADRTLLRDALCVTLAKGEDEVSRFERCFDTFFKRDSIEPAIDVDDNPPEDAPDLVRQVLLGDEAALSRAMEVAGAQVGAGNIRLATQRNLLVRRVLDAMGLRELEAMMHGLRERDGNDDRLLAERLAEARRDLFARASAYVDREAALHAGESGRRLREALLSEQNLGAIAPEDFSAMERLVRRMARRLATRYARKRRQAKRGRLDVRSTLRRSMGHGGISFDVVWKTKVLHKPKIVVICDVSRSVANAAQFLLLFLYALGEAVAKLDAYAFSDRLAPVNDVLDAETVYNAITIVLTRVGFRPTNYGRALSDFRELAGASLDRRTTVIVLGDGRSNGADPRLDLMREVADRARAVIWLNPEPETLWDQGDSEMHAYRRFCTVARTCNTLKALERIIDDMLRTYAPITLRPAPHLGG
jgi:uncharacterized protein with von Willebrand factor type A (vWA) domain